MQSTESLSYIGGQCIHVNINGIQNTHTHDNTCSYLL